MTELDLSRHGLEDELNLPDDVVTYFKDSLKIVRLQKKNLKSIELLNQFPNLTKVIAHNNKLSKADLSLPNLTKLNLKNNRF